MTKQITYNDYKTNTALRKKYFLYTCPDGITKHALDFEVPRNIEKSVFEYYGLELDYSVKNSRLELLPLYFKCLYCTHSHYTTPKICTNCQKCINPISKKLTGIVTNKIKHLACTCHDTTRT